jgi:transcriptional regulator of met regulon
MQYTATMKTAVIPQVRVEPELRADLDSVLLPGETLSEFVEASVRRAVEFRRVQTDFAVRCEASLAAFERTGVSIPSDLVLSKLEAKVAARVKQLRK